MDQVEHQLLRRVWFPLARIEDVADGVVQGNILGTELVVYRVGGVTTVAGATCPHRGMPLWMGRLEDGNLECPYHGWQFEPGTARCVRIPSLPPELAPGRVSLETYPVREAYGHVWASLEEPYLPFPELAEYSEETWQLGFGVPHDLGCGMRQLTENFRDMAHFPFVHSSSMGPNVRRTVDPYEVARDGWELEWIVSTDLGGTALNANPALSNRLTHTYHLVLPMFTYMRTSFPNGGRRMVAQFATPISEDGLRVRLFWVVGIDRTVADQHGVSLSEMWEYERQIFEEDYPIVESQRPREAPLDVRLQAHTRADRFSVVYRRTYADLMRTFDAERGAGPSEAPRVAAAERA
jgi:phenylpropionate dioxygenase-like ring-hydroxylating dioxygenase large terminal subunit